MTMKKRYLLITIILFTSAITFCQDPGWPRQLTNKGSVLILYTPQVENWQDYTVMNFRMAFALTPYQGKQVVGVVYINATTYNNTYDHMVKIFDLNITDIHFPGMDDASASTLSHLARGFLDPAKTVNISMERIVACTPKPQTINTIQVKNDPPSIFISNSPAILLQLEGQPVLTDATKGGIKYIVNANWPVFFDPKSSAYFLYDNLEWQTAGQLSGPWRFTTSLPSSLVALVNDQNWSGVLKPAIPAPAKSPDIPGIFYSTGPAEIILFKGAPKMAPVSGTSLEYATNTNSAIFFCNSNNSYYYLAAGRWFSAPDLKGPWTYATNTLPADFAKIPTDCPVAGVLSSVPGTDQAADAVMIAQIPTVTTKDPKQAPTVTITYSGTPKYIAIEGTTLYYVENTSDKVIKVDNDQFYACVGGFWYSSSFPQGPWALATSVPPIIYTIPPNCPVYNLTYVTQTVIVSGEVQSSYTAGYMGAYVVGVGTGVIIASGTGYYYPPYIYYPPYGYPVCYASAVTYGAYAYHPYGYYGAVGYGASYNPYTGTYSRSATAYGPYGSTTAKQSYNPYTGTVGRGASVSTPYGTSSAGQAYNPYTGQAAATRQGSNANGQAGTSVYNSGNGTTTKTSHATNNYGQSVGTAQNTNGAKAAGATGPNGTAAVGKSASGDMYATKDGNVYSNSGGSWSQVSNTKTGSPSSSSATAASSPYSSATTPKSTSANASSAAAQSSASGFSNKSDGGSAPSPELQSASQNRARGNSGANSWSGGTTSGRSGGGWGGGGGGRGRR